MRFERYVLLSTLGLGIGINAGVVGCGASDPGTVPVLELTPIEIGETYDSATFRLGDLYCGPSGDSAHQWCFDGFATMSPTDSSYDYRTIVDANVRASSGGIVASILEDDNVDGMGNPIYPGEFEIHIAPDEDSDYRVIYDHVRDLTVEVGDVVLVGESLGIVGVTSGEENTSGRVELQINIVGSRATRHCPSQFGLQDFNAAHERALTRHNAEFPTAAAESTCLRESN